MKRIIVFASSHKIGLSGELTEQAVKFNELYPGEFLFVSGEKEQCEGLFNKLKAHGVAHKTIIGVDEHHSFWKHVRKFADLARENRTDHVTVQTNWQLAIVAFTRLLSGQKYSITYIVRGYRSNSPIKSKIALGLINLALCIFANTVITPSTFIKRKFRWVGKKAKVIYLGEDDILFAGVTPPDFRCKKKIIFPAAFRDGKNQERLIDFVSDYIKKTGDSDIELFLPGEGDNLQECKEKVRRLALESKVFFPGFIDRQGMLELYNRCQFAIVSSSSETFGHCIVEPIVMGRVLLTTPVGVANDIIEHGVNGYIYNDWKELLEVFTKLSNDVPKCEQVSASALLCRDQFRWEKICRQIYEEIYSH